MNTDWLSWLATWLATYALHSTLLLVAAWALTRLPALRAPRASEVVWRTALFGGVLTACLHVVLGAPLWRTPLVERSVPESQSTAREVSLPTVEVALPVEATVPEVSPVLKHVDRAVASPAAEPPSPAWLLLLWPLGCGVLLWRRRRSHRRFTAALEHRHDAAPSDLRALVSRLAGEAGLGRPVRLTLSTTLASPVAFGTRRPEICLPERAVETLSPRHLEAMLAHEVAHLARRDPAWLRAYRCISALLFFQPLNHVAVSRLRDASEMLCDAWAATSRPRRVALAECLTIVADWIVAGAPPEGAVAMARKTSRLGDRVHALLEPADSRTGPGRAPLGALALAPLLLVMAFAPGLRAVAAPPTTAGTALDVPDEEVDPVAALDAELALLATEVAELTALLDATDRPELARRIEAHLSAITSRRDALLRALAAEGR